MLNSRSVLLDAGDQVSLDARLPKALRPEVRAADIGPQLPPAPICNHEPTEHRHAQDEMRVATVRDQWQEQEEIRVVTNRRLEQEEIRGVPENQFEQEGVQAVTDQWQEQEEIRAVTGHSVS